MSRNKEMLKNTFIYAIGSFGSKILTFLILPLYAHYFTTNSYGQYDTVNSLISLLMPLITLMLDNACYVFIINPYENTKPETVMSYVIKVISMNVLITSGLFVIMYKYLDIQYKLLCYLWLISGVYLSVWYSCCRGLKKSFDYAVAGIINTIISLSINLLGIVVLKADYYILIGANILANVGSILYIEFRVHIIEKIKNIKYDKAFKKAILQFSLPVIPNQVSWWILNLSDRLMIMFFCGSAQNGLYAMAGKVPGILTILGGLFTMAWSDNILSCESLSSIEDYVNKTFNRFVKLGACLTFFLITINKFIYFYYIGGNFSSAYQYASLLYIGVLFSVMASMLGPFYGYYKKSFNVALSGIIAAILNFIVNLLFMPYWGTVIACFSTVLGYFIMFLLRFIGLKSMVKLRLTSQNVLLLLLLIIPLLTQQINSLLLQVCTILISVALGITLNLDTLQYILQYTYKKIKPHIKGGKN